MMLLTSPTPHVQHQNFGIHLRSLGRHIIVPLAQSLARGAKEIDDAADITYGTWSTPKVYNPETTENYLACSRRKPHFL
jgi:hypothetical protein